MEYKKEFTEEECADLIAWFKKHREEFPQVFQFDAAIRYNNLPYMIPFYIDILEAHRKNPTSSGQLFTLFRLRDELKKQAGIAD